MRAPIACCVLVLLGLTAASIEAGQIHVPGDYVVLQDAIDAALPGDVILIDGGSHPPVVIDTPVYLVGYASNRPLLRPYLAGEAPPGGQQPPVHLSGPGLEGVTLSGIDIGGATDGGWFFDNVPAITGGGFDELRLLHCDVRAPGWDGATGTEPVARPALDVDVSYLLVEDSTVVGGVAVTDFFWADPDVPGGGAGIRCTGDVAVFDSTVRGGPGLDVTFDDGLFAPDGCDGVTGGRGGPGIVTSGKLYRGRSTIQGGPGADIDLEIQGVTFDLCTLEPGLRPTDRKSVV